MKLTSLRAAEFFAGIGLVRDALSSAGIEVVWANDIDESKARLYRLNYGDADLLVGDVRQVRGDQVPDVSLATASFPCTDLSLAGWRRGLDGEQSGMFWEFARVLEEMGTRRPSALLLENVPSFATSRGGADFVAAISRLNALGYWCDPFLMDARYFVPQSRPRLFIACSQQAISHSERRVASEIRPASLLKIASYNPHLNWMSFGLPVPHPSGKTLADVVERLPKEDARWWDEERLGRFLDSLSPLQRTRLDRLRSPKLFGADESPQWATAYRRTRHGAAVWEIRPDSISGCLRTARGGSSRQALVEFDAEGIRVRWMTSREYARLQGSPDYRTDGATENEALFGFGDAVCTPVVGWIAKHYLGPLLRGELTGEVQYSAAYARAS